MLIFRSITFNGNTPSVCLLLIHIYILHINIIITGRTCHVHNDNIATAVGQLVNQRTYSNIWNVYFKPKIPKYILRQPLLYPPTRPCNELTSQDYRKGTEVQNLSSSTIRLVNHVHCIPIYAGIILNSTPKRFIIYILLFLIINQFKHNI